MKPDKAWEALLEHLEEMRTAVNETATLVGEMADTMRAHKLHSPKCSIFRYAQVDMFVPEDKCDCWLSKAPE